MRAFRLAAWLLPVSVRRYRSALVIGALSVGLFGIVAQWAGQAVTPAPRTRVAWARPRCGRSRSTATAEAMTPNR